MERITRTAVIFLFLAALLCPATAALAQNSTNASTPSQVFEDYADAFEMALYTLIKEYFSVQDKPSLGYRDLVNHTQAGLYSLQYIYKYKIILESIEDNIADEAVHATAKKMYNYSLASGCFFSAVSKGSFDYKENLIYPFTDDVNESSLQVESIYSEIDSICQTEYDPSLNGGKDMDYYIQNKKEPLRTQSKHYSNLSDRLLTINFQFYSSLTDDKSKFNGLYDGFLLFSFYRSFYNISFFDDAKSLCSMIKSTDAEAMHKINKNYDLIFQRIKNDVEQDQKLLSYLSTQQHVKEERKETLQLYSDFLSDIINYAEEMSYCAP